MISLPNPKASKMTDSDLTKLKEKFCSDIVENMDLDTLIDIVYEQQLEYYAHFKEEEFKDEVITYYCNDEQQWDDLVESIQ